MELAARKGLKVAAAGSHPFSSWMDQEITPLERYMGVREDLQDLAQALLIFGTHVHIGIEDREFLIDAMNISRYFLPHVLALSTSSPFWMGRRTLPGVVGRIRKRRQRDGRDQLDPQRVQDLVGSPAQLELSHPRVPGLRRLYQGG
jgi:hypothetical protein